MRISLYNTRFLRLAQLIGLSCVFFAFNSCITVRNGSLVISSFGKGVLHNIHFVGRLTCCIAAMFFVYISESPHIYVCMCACACMHACISIQLYVCVHVCIGGVKYFSWRPNYIANVVQSPEFNQTICDIKKFNVSIVEFVIDMCLHVFVFLCV